jgi:hypothetical protein
VRDQAGGSARLTRRGFIEGAVGGAIGAAALSCALPGEAAAHGAGRSSGRVASGRGPVRRFHASLSADALKLYPDLPRVVAEAGLTDVWVAGFLYGGWYRDPQQMREVARAFEAEGLTVHGINVPLGHPGNALGAVDDIQLLTPPAHWHMAKAADGTLFSGTSLHAPAVEENCAALRAEEAAGFTEVFLDDDFRLARSPGTIGGCFCDECRRDFLKLHGYPEGRFDELLADVSRRNPSALLRQWIDMWCDRLYGAFRTMERAAPGITLGNMAMYFGSEKAGIALPRFGRHLFRVGELMFDDGSFAPIRGKTNELFSVLFHRRFARAELAFSETTAFPNDQLSAANMAAKLTISLIADVRNTMYMSGLLPFPIEHWATLGPAMAESARLQEHIAGHLPAGPFKHFHGMDERLVGNDSPLSLFLASGVPFEVVDELPLDGWAFLGDADARAVAEGRLDGRGRRLFCRPGAAGGARDLTPLEDTLEAVFALKRRILPSLAGVPYLEPDRPAVFAWYPTAGRAIVWNLEESPATFDVRQDGRTLATVDVAPLGVAMVTVPRG